MMKDATVTKKGLVLSVLPGLSLLLVTHLWQLSETPSGLIPFFLSIVSFFPLSLLYLIYLHHRQERLPKEHLLAPWCRAMVRLAWGSVGGSLAVIVGSTFIGVGLGLPQGAFLLDVLIWVRRLAAVLLLALPVIFPILELVIFLKWREPKS